MAVKTLNESTEIREIPRTLALAPTANSLDDIMVAPTVAADGINFKQTGREIVIIRNTDPTNPYTFTLKSVADELNRIGDVGPYTLQAGETATIIINTKGFKDSNGMALIVMENVAVKIAVNRVPSQL